MGIWGQFLKQLLVVLMMTRGCFYVIFSHPDQASWVLSKFWHIKMTHVLLKRWMPLFDQYKEKLGAGPIWFRIPSLPLYFWSEDVFRCISDDLGIYLDQDKSFIEIRNVTIARILVHLDTRDGLVDNMWLQYHGYVRWKILDYKGVPFHCRRCHEVGNLYKDCSLLTTDNKETSTRHESTRLKT